MSDAKMAEYYPPMTDYVPSFAWRPCLKCGAMIHRPAEQLHVDWHEAQAHTPQLQPDHQPQGNNFATTEIRYASDRNHELNGNDRPGHYGRGISLKWSPDGR